MTRDEIIEELRNIHGSAKLLVGCIDRITPKGMPLAHIKDVTIDGEKYGFLYNDASGLEYVIRQLLERATAASARTAGGENIIDFNTEAPKHRGKTKPKGANRND